MIVSERVNFERTGDPIRTMGVGRQILDNKVLQNTDWAVKPVPNKFIVITIIRDYRGFPILVLQLAGEQYNPLFVATTDKGIQSSYYNSLKDAVREVQSHIDGYLASKNLTNDNTKRVSESVNFERTDKPFDALKIGRIKWSNLVDFTILQANKNVKRNSQNRISELSEYKIIPVGEYLRISDVQYHPDKCISFTYYSYFTLAGAMGKSYNEATGNRMTYQEDGFIWGSIPELEECFRILQPSELKETQNFERTGSPLDTLQVGQIGRTNWDPKELFDAMYKEAKVSKNFNNVEINLEAKEPFLKIESKEGASTNSMEWIPKSFTFYLTDEGIIAFQEWIQDDEVMVDTLKDFLELTDCRKVPKELKEAQHFQRRGEPLDTLQVGRVEERREKKIHDEMKEALKERFKKLGLKIKIKDESVEGKTDLRFKYEIWTYVFIHMYDRKENWDQFTVGFIDYEDAVDSTDYDTMDEALNKLDTWLFPDPPKDLEGKIMVTEVQNFERKADPKESIGIGIKTIIYQKLNDFCEQEMKKDRMIYSFYPSGVDKEYYYFYGAVTGSMVDFLIKDHGLDTYLEVPGERQLKGQQHTIKYKVKEPYQDIFKKISSLQILGFKKSNESQNFERGQTPIRSMDIGMGKKLGPYFEVFMEMYQVAKECPDFEVTKIDWPAGFNTPIYPVFTIYTQDEYEYTDINMNKGAGYKSYRVSCGIAGVYIQRKEERREETIKTVEEFKKFIDRSDIKESQNFERGQEPIKSMDIGMEAKYGRFYEPFVKMHNMAENSDNFEYVSEIVWEPTRPGDDKDVPFFNIESKFHGYNPTTKEMAPEQFVIMLYKIYIACYRVLDGEELAVPTKEKFDEITRCFDEG